MLQPHDRVLQALCAQCHCADAAGVTEAACSTVLSASTSSLEMVYAQVREREDVAATVHGECDVEVREGVT